MMNSRGFGSYKKIIKNIFPPWAEKTFIAAIMEREPSLKGKKAHTIDLLGTN
jgi:hypothetical protein